MAFNPTQNASVGAARSVGNLVVPEWTKACKFAPASGAPTVKRNTPVAYDSALDKWVVWSALGGAFGAKNETASIAVDATGGTFRITVEGQTTADIAFNATAAAVQAALELLPGMGPGDVVVTGGPGVAGGGTPYVLTWGGRYEGNDAPAVTTVVTGTPPLLTGGAATAVVTTVAGVEPVGRNEIRGFTYEDDIALHATNDTLITVMTEGEIHYDEIELPAGETADNLKAALRSGPQEKGLRIVGLTNVR